MAAAAGGGEVGVGWKGGGVPVSCMAGGGGQGGD